MYSNLGKTCETVDRIRGVYILISESNIAWYMCTCMYAYVYVSTYVCTRAQMNNDFNI